MVKLRHSARFRVDLSYRCRDMVIFRFFRPPSWICYARVRTTHEEGHLTVFIAVQNLVGIDAVVWWYACFSISRVLLEKAYSRPEDWGFGGFENSPYLGNGLTDCHEIWHVDAVWPLWPFCSLNVRNFKMAAAYILKSRTLAISQQRGTRGDVRFQTGSRK